jgi:murein DD-endopeptidase MepM/ murein hydrolase activator NlpD
MPKRKEKLKRFFDKLKNKYRLVIMNDESFEEKFSFRLSRLNVFIVAGALIIVLIFLTTYIIAFTPLREYIPGYGSNNSKNVRELILKTDSLEEDAKNKDLYFYNIKNIIEGKEVVEHIPDKPDCTSTKYDNITLSKSKEDSALRAEMEGQDQYNVSVNDEPATQQISSISNLLFFTPLKGIVVNSFNAVENHYGVDIVAPKNEAIKSTLDGTVIFSSWTLSTGYVIAVQHQSNLISVYKHNSVLLKKEGAFVRAGEVIAIIGESGEVKTGPHLHFELWYNGSPINPKDYIVF